MKLFLQVHFIIVILVSLATMSIGGHLENGREAAESGDFEKARQLWLIASQQGNAAAQINLGTLYAKGLGVPQNDVEALKWFRMAAMQGDAKAQSYLGFLYANGLGTEQDDREAAKWFHKAAVQGDAKAQLSLGVMYNVGRGVARNDVVACAWYDVAAKAGNVAAQSHLDTARQRMTPDEIKMSQQLAEQLRAEVDR